MIQSALKESYFNDVRRRDEQILHFVQDDGASPRCHPGQSGLPGASSGSVHFTNRLHCVYPSTIREESIYICGIGKQANHSVFTREIAAGLRCLERCRGHNPENDLVREIKS